MKRDQQTLRLHMGCGEALNGRVVAQRTPSGERHPGRPRPTQRKPGRGKR